MRPLFQAVAVLAALGAGWLAHSEANAQIIPIAECVQIDHATGEAIGHFGYASQSDTSQSIPVGSNNFFSPPPINRGQSQTFDPGLHISEFTVTWDPANHTTLTWTLLGISAELDTENPDHHCTAMACVFEPGVTGADGPIGPAGADGPDGDPGPRGPAGDEGAAGTPAPAAHEGCRTVEMVSASSQAQAACDSSEWLVSGSGACADQLTPHASNWSTGQLQASNPTGAGAWTAECLTGTATARAFCCPAEGSTE